MLKGLVQELPVELPATVLVVQHVGTSSGLAALLDRRGGIPVAAASSGAPVERGRVHVAPPNAHLLVHGDHLLLSRSPRENLARPAVDPLFRSAASTYGGRVIGVILSGVLNDGTSGLDAVKRCGGVAVVQDPADALAPDMPASALRQVDVDHSVPAAELAGLLTRLAAEPAGPAPEIPLDIRLEAAIAAQDPHAVEEGNRMGRSANFTCPECAGPLWEVARDPVLRYRYRVGHGLTSDAVLEAQERQIEDRLWGLVQIHRQRASLTRLVAGNQRAQGWESEARRLRERAAEYERDAGHVERLISEWSG